MKKKIIGIMVVVMMMVMVGFICYFVGSNKIKVTIDVTAKDEIVQQYDDSKVINEVVAFDGYTVQETIRNNEIHYYLVAKDGKTFEVTKDYVFEHYPAMTSEFASR